MRVLDLFSGIGGFSLGLERAGMRTVAFCEIDPYCRAVLAKHWPSVPIHGDIRTLDAATVATYCAGQHEQWCLASRSVGGQSKETTGNRGVDIICGGFPCQPFSHAGRRRGAEDDRHLWPEMARVISEVRPTWVIGENVAGLVTMGLDLVLSDLEAMGYAVQTFCIPACAVDAPHRRDRLWIVAHAECRGLQRGTGGGMPSTRGSSSIIAGRNQGHWCQWLPEPGLGRVAHGIPRRVDRLRALGNAVVPQVVEEIGRAIIKAEREFGQ